MAKSAIDKLTTDFLRFGTSNFPVVIVNIDTTIKGATKQKFTNATLLLFQIYLLLSPIIR